MRRRRTPEVRPYWVAGCNFEPQGLLEVWISPRGRPGLVCDECRLVWLDPTDLAVESSYMPPAGTADLPDGDTLDPPSARPATRADLEDAGWWPYVSQTSRAEHGDEILTLPEGIDPGSLVLRQRGRGAEITFAYRSPGGDATHQGALSFDWVLYVQAERAEEAEDAPAEPADVFELLDSDLRRRLSTRSPAAARHFHLSIGSHVFDIVAAVIDVDLAVGSDSAGAESDG